MRIRSGALGVLLACQIAGCTSHDERFEGEVPPKAGDKASQILTTSTAASEIVDLYRRRARSLPTDALIPISRAAATIFGVNGAPGVRATSRVYGDQLLAARTPVGGGDGYFGSLSPGRPQSGTTSAAGLALLDLFKATQDSRFRAAAQRAARAVISGELGWRRRGGSVGVLARGRAGFSIADTATAGAFLSRAAKEVGTKTTSDAKAAFRLVLDNQAALGNWYAAVGSERPQTLEQWATTLDALLDKPDPDRIGVADPGLGKLWKVSFETSGRPARKALRNVGPVSVARILDAAAASPAQAFATRGLAYLVRHRRPDGTAAFGPADDPTAQAHVALALARRARILKTGR